MNLCRLRPKLAPKWLNTRSTSILATESEYTATPQYPEIQDLEYLSKLQRKKDEARESIKDVPTVEEKQIRLNMPRYYGFKTYVLSEDYVPYNNLSMVQHVTRTHLINCPKLPEYYEKQVKSVQNLEELKNDVQEALLIELEGYKQQQDITSEQLSDEARDNFIGSRIAQQLNRTIINNLSTEFEHLKAAQLDLNPRVECSWYAGGMVPPENVRRYRLGREWTKQYENLPTDRLMSYEGKGALQLRADLPLNSIISFKDSENEDFVVPWFEYDPRTVGTKTVHKRMVNLPGFFPGEPHRFGLLSYHTRGHILTRKRYNDPKDDQEALQRQGIVSSFGWLSAQANLLGFNTFNDITYPLVTQTLITNGQLWNVFVYQLNTMLLHSNNVKDNPRKNICWSLPETKLYDTIENGKILGFNDDLLSILCKLYSNKPEARLGTNLTPYLNKPEKLASDYQDQEKREWLEREYKFLTSNRARFREIDEIYHWEKIYKVDHETRFMEKRLRFFELGKKPQDRKLNDRQAKYIPRKLRPDLPRHKGRYAKEFWP